MMVRRQYRHMCLYAMRVAASVTLALALPHAVSAQAAQSAQAKGPTGTLSGTVVDDSGGLVPGVTVAVRSVENGLRREVTTNEAGAFTFPLLQAARYVLSATLQGFAPIEIPDVIVKPNDQQTLLVKLKLATVGENVTVTAQKRGEERLRDVPIPVTVLNADSLVDNGQLLLRDYYSNVPGLNLSAGLYSMTTLTIRGTNSGGGDPTVGVIIDDVSFGSSTGYGTWIPDFDPGDLTQVEVLRGPQGALYGANSMGGLLKYVTKDPSTHGFEGSVDVGTTAVYNGDKPGLNLRGAMNVPVNNTLALRISGYARQDPGFIDNPVYHRRATNEVDNGGGRLSGLWQASPDSSLRFSAMYQRTIPNAPPEVTLVPGMSGLEQYYLPGVRGFERALQAYSASFRTKLRNIQLVSLAGYNINNSTGTLDWTGYYADTFMKDFGVSGAIHTNHSTTTRLTEEVRASSSIGRKIEWQGGFFYSHEDLKNDQHLRAVDPTTLQVVAEFGHYSYPEQFDSTAGFGDVTVHVTPRFDLQLGGRLSHEKLFEEVGITEGIDAGGVTVSTPSSVTPFNTFTYLVTPRFTLSGNVMLYGRAASGYRPGLSNAVVVPLVTEKIPLKADPDKTQNYELGLKGDFLDHRLSLDASLYYIDWQHIQIGVETEKQAWGYTTNGSRAKSEGVELSAAVMPLKGLRIAAWDVINNAVLTEPFPANSTAHGAIGDRLPEGSRHSGNFSVEQNFPVSNSAIASIGGKVSYIGARLGAFTASGVRDEYGAYTKTDFSAGLKYSSWMISLFLNNALDERGVIGKNPFTLDSLIYIQPRTVGVSLTRRF